MIEPDALNPCAPDSKRDPLFRIRYYANRLSLEIHHVVTDGGGAMVFFKTLLAQYSGSRDMRCHAPTAF